jgi:hypothetical protein
VRRHLSRTDSLHSLHYLLNCTCKTAQDARQFVLALFSVMYRPNGSSYPQKQHRTLANFFERFFGHVPTARLKLPLKTAQDARHFLLALFSVMYRSNGSSYP